MCNSKFCDKFNKFLPIICGLLTSFVAIFVGIWILVQGIVENNWIGIGGPFFIITGILSGWFFIRIFLQLRSGEFRFREDV